MESLDLSLTLDREHLQKLLISSLTRLCHSKVSFKSTLAIEGLLGLTVDNTTVQLISIKEVLHNGVVSRDCSSDLSGMHPAVSRSRRKSKVTRKAVVSLESDCGSNLNDDWNMNGLDDDEEEDDGKDAKPSDSPLNLVKCENVDSSVDTHEEKSSSSTAQVTTDQMDTKLNVCVSDQMFIPNTAQQELSSNSSHSWTLPLSNIRKYGSYGYVINQGNDVMFSCNQCPKTFRNRVSLWRHGVKHKMSQDSSSSSKVIPSGLWSSMVSARDNNSTLNVHKVTSQPAEVANNPEPFQDNCFGSLVGSHLMDRLNNHTVQGRKLKRKKEVRIDKQSTELCVPTLVSSVNSGIMMRQFKAVEKDLRTSQTLSPDSLSCLTDEQMELGSKLQDADDKVREATNACVGEETKVAHSALRECKESMPVSHDSDLVPPLCVHTDQTNMRLISGYGYVVDTADGKLYKCLKCLKSFKNRVSLWKHQSKHQ